MKNYEDINLQQEDAYDDSDYQPYELMDYNCQEEEEETTIEPQLKKGRKNVREWKMRHQKNMIFIIQ